MSSSKDVLDVEGCVALGVDLVEITEDKVGVKHESQLDLGDDILEQKVKRLELGKELLSHRNVLFARFQALVLRAIRAEGERRHGGGERGSATGRGAQRRR